MVSTADQIMGSNPAGGGILLMTVWHFIAQRLSLSHFHHLDMTYVRDVKNQGPVVQN